MVVGQKDMIELFSRLGERLAGFGSDVESAAAARRASEANQWFTVRDVIASVAAIRDNMLREDALENWLSGYGPDYANPADVAVIMAGNIPLVGFHDLLCVLACGHACHLKPSSKDTVLIEYIVGLLKEIRPDLPIYGYDGSRDYDAVIATGSDNTNRYFRARFGAIPALFRGSRDSVAVITGKETDGELRKLSEDIFMYSGLGCRNVNLLFVPRGYDAEQLAKAISPSDVNPKYLANYRYTRARLMVTGKPLVDGGCFVMTEETAFPDALSRINYVRYDDMAEVLGWLADNDDKVQCVAGNIAHPRRTDFGKTQRPAPGDYADGRDTMEFLMEINVAGGIYPRI